MRVLITGGAGYIGYGVVERLLKHTRQLHSVTIYDNLSRKNYNFFTGSQFDHKPVRFIQGDILDGRSLLKALDGIDCVVHLAARVTTPFADQEAHTFDQINHWGSAQLAAALEKHPVERTIYLSSMSVYGSSPQPVNERVDPTPHSFYGISKLDGERQFDTIRQFTDLYVLRSGTVYGYKPTYRLDSVINRFMFNAHFKGLIKVHGSGNQIRAFIHVDKIAQLIAAAVERKYEPGLYNAVEHNLSINTIAGYVRQLYPTLETIHVNYNIEMRSVAAELPCAITTQYQFQERSFEDELKDFQSHFSF